MIKSLRPYFRFLKPYKWPYLGGLIFGVIYGAMSGFGMAFITAKVLPSVFADERPSTLVLVGVVLLIPLVALVRGVSGFLSSYLMGYCNEHVSLSMRMQLMNHIQLLSLAFFHKTRTGNLSARVINDTQRIASVITRSSGDMVRQPVTILGAFCVIVYLSFEQRELGFLAIAFLMLPLCITPIRTVGKRIANREQQMGMSEGGLHSVIHEEMAAARETRVFNLHQRQVRRFYDQAVLQKNIILHLLFSKNLISPSVEVVSALGVSGAILYAAINGVALETMVPLLIALYMCYEPFKKVGAIYASLKQAELAAGRLERIYESPDRLQIASGPIDVSGFKGEIMFDEVAFAYNQKPVFNGLSVSISRGQVVALVGHSGSGKSTFCNLLGRLYDPSSGRVLLDGVDISQLNEGRFRDLMAFVPQDCFLFADSILENIRVGRLDASDEEVIRAAKQANAHEFIIELPDAYGTIVAERGASLSGGQRQRIAIARAFLRKSEILVLDEATSALDSESEERVQKAIERLMVGKTVIIIAHRYSTIQMAERVLLFDNGSIVEDGSLNDLLERSEIFRKIRNQDDLDGEFGTE